jgi:predicted site-specific integrase-resolvase
MRGTHDHMSITEAAGFSDVSDGTPRNWDRLGKLKAVRDPMDRYRLNEGTDLEDLLRRPCGCAWGKAQTR